MNVLNTTLHTDSQLKIENDDVLNLFSQFSQPTLKYREQLKHKLFDVEHKGGKLESANANNPSTTWAVLKHSSQTIPAIKYVTALTNRIKVWKPAALVVRYLMPLSKN